MKITLTYDQKLKKFFYIPCKYISNEDVCDYKNYEELKEGLNNKEDYLTILYYIPKKQFDYNREGVFVIDKEFIRAIYESHNQVNDESDYENLKEGTLVTLVYKLKRVYQKREECLI